MNLLGMKRLKMKERKEAEKMSCCCNRTSIAFPAIAFTKVLLTLRIWVQLMASHVCIWCRLGPFPYSAGDRSHWTCCIEDQVTLPCHLDWNTPGQSVAVRMAASDRLSSLCTVDWSQSLLKLAADFSGLQSRFWPDSHGRKRSFCPQTEMSDTSTGYTAQPMQVFLLLAKPPLLSLLKLTANLHPYTNVTGLLLTLRVIGPGPTDAEPVEMESVSDHVLLGLEEDDVHLGCEQAAQHNKAAQTHRDAHGGGLHLGESGRRAPCFSTESSEMQNVRSIIIKWQEPQSWGFALVVWTCHNLIFHNPGAVWGSVWSWWCPVSLRIRGRLTLRLAQNG